MPRLGPSIRGLVFLGLVACLALGLVGCGADAASAPTPASIPTPTPRPTVALGFAVVVTPVVRHVRPRPHPTARPTPVRAPSGPYLTLAPRSGPPASRTIWIGGGHLPPDEAVDLAWSPQGNTSPVSTIAYTGSRGNLSAQFTVPGSPPGIYRVVVLINGVPYASARYRVVSVAAVAVSVTPGAKGERLVVEGRHFLPHLRLLLISYAISSNQKPLIVGTVTSSGQGKFSLAKTIKGLPAGQYVLRAAAYNSYAVQVADAFFQVVM